jgi:SAM-dependent methyltransferase
VLEVGSGRGGGLSYFKKYLHPASAVGVDYSQRQIDFCNRIYSREDLTFICGDAEKLPSEASKFDVVINVESSHYYGNMRLFVSEVSRVLKPAGLFMFADFRPTSEVAELEKTLTSTLMTIAEKKDITDYVLRALSLDSKRRLSLIQTKAHFCKG